MLDILEIAREKGIEEGKTLGIEEGKTLGILEDRRELVMDGLMERFSTVPVRLLDRIRALDNPMALKLLLRQVGRCQSVSEFEVFMDQVL